MPLQPNIKTYKNYITIRPLNHPVCDASYNNYTKVYRKSSPYKLNADRHKNTNATNERYPWQNIHIQWGIVLKIQYHLESDDIEDFQPSWRGDRKTDSQTDRLRHLNRNLLCPSLSNPAHFPSAMIYSLLVCIPCPEPLPLLPSVKLGYNILTDCHSSVLKKIVDEMKF